METKAIFLDLDGTLLTDEKTVTDGNREAIKKALAAGHRVVINTGRPLLSGIRLSEALGLTDQGCYLISYNGSTIYDIGNRKKLFEKTVPRELIYQIFAEANRRGLYIQTYDESNVLVEAQNDNAWVRKYCSVTTLDYKIMDDYRNIDWDPVKALVIDWDNRPALEEFREWVLASFPGVLNSFFSSNTYLEVVSTGFSKGSSMLKLSEMIGIKPENTIACGDAENDVEMVSMAGLGVCMANGIDDLKKIAGYVTIKDNNHDGIAEVIEKFMLTE